MCDTYTKGDLIMSEKKAFLLIFVAWVLGLVVCGGCASPHRAEANRVSYQLQTRCPDIWDEQPKQEVSVKIEFRR